MTQLPVHKAIDGTYYVKHKRKQWRPTDKGGSILIDHRPTIRYESPIKNYERHQALRALRKSEEVDVGSL